MAHNRFAQGQNGQRTPQFYTPGHAQTAPGSYPPAPPQQQQHRNNQMMHQQYQAPAQGSGYAPHQGSHMQQFQPTQQTVGTGFLKPGEDAPAAPIQWAGASGSQSQDPSVFGNMVSADPAQQYDNQATGGTEPPLLEELGINPDHIIKKTLAVLIPTRDVKELAHDSDMAGPIAFCLALGTLLMASGELHFSIIYTFFLFGSFAIYVVLNLMAQNEGIDVLRVFSVLGYCLLPIVFLSAISVFLDLSKMWWGSILALVFILWCTLTSTRFFEAGLMCREQRYLIAYPLFLLYSCFALITVF